MALTKNKLIQLVAEQQHITLKDAALLVEELITLIKATLESGESLKIAKFGLFEVKEKHARRGRNPQTGEAITIEPRKVISFKPSVLLRQAINQ
ncbi:histone family protein DNA-binding protein (plasmid) [Trichlorobacter lovleyi SZ]|uniref:Integration host factor subunit alpha n=2 Tax=Trichlorobacter lovleyi TaxID=313985 RepID=B3EBV2_TRIL1|nr:histone family protein DNA-binding protein [Trichlorobacter lovleyi SZ]